MPTIEVDCLLRHCTDPSIKREAAEWQALHAVNVVKGKELRGSFNFQITGRGGVSINARNASLFLEEVSYRSAHHIRSKYGKNVCIVPVPNSSAIASNRKSFKTLEIATRVAALVGAPCSALDLLRWKLPVGMAHKGERTRSVDAHKGQMKVMSTTNLPIVIFDDVVTSGSQLCAAQALLEGAGMTVAGMLAVAEVVNQGERSDTPGWRTTTRNPFSISDFMDGFSF
ncbi:phosphoribosyltransferase [Sinorhizobium meliloti]|uniref:phosphoribosyltransferase n=1 Tax=Rhizobium meliloti TaxID=382 RepID=UPI000FD55881|nr:phosphoribosyltransferase [Sinorhizobium meliloti]RVG92107.1 phosphoribosyltransferase [Sinorhizobium meliloti]RVP82047.1 phosphoribosyltransferase [Sinorhizobium meliloti]